MKQTLIIGTRASKLALVQTYMVRDALQSAQPGLTVAVEHITTRGDIILDRPLNAIGDKGLFVVEIEEAMRAGRIDLAVHSAKDLPSMLPPDMTLAACPRRADPRDALVAHPGMTLAALPSGAQRADRQQRMGSGRTGAAGDPRNQATRPATDRDCRCMRL